MWLTGNDAVNRYDGSRVKVYNLNKYFSNCPNLQQGYGFAEDNQSNIYIGSVNGLYIYHRDQDKFTLQKIYDGSDQTTMPIGFKDGKIWCYNKQYQLVSFDVGSHKIENICRITLPPIKSIHIYDLASNIFYYRFPFIAEDAVWFVDAKEVICYSIKTKKISFPIKEKFPTEDFIFYSSCYDKFNKRILIGTVDKILNYSLKNNQISSIGFAKNKKDRLKAIVSIASNKDYIAYRQNDHLFVCKSNFENTQQIDKNITETNRTFQLNFDKNDRLWMCVDGIGQCIYDLKPPLLNKETSENTKLFPYLNYGVICFAEFPNKDILIHNRINKTFNGNTYQILNYDDNNYGYRVTTDYYRKGIWQYISLIDNATKIYFIDENKKRKLVAFFDAKLKLGSIQDLQILDNQSILCSFQSGLYWFDLATKKMIKIGSQPQENCFKINKLSNNRIAISYLSGSMWLAKINLDKTLTFIKKILPKQQSFYVQEDETNKRYWVGTNNGVYLLDSNYNTINKFDANGGMAGTYIYGLLLDDSGNLWCSHQRGLSSIDAKSFKIINYTKSDGIQDWDFNNRAFYKATDGTLYFGGVNGFNYFKPPLKQSTYYQPKIYIDEILVNSMPLKTEKWADVLTKLNLKSDQNNLSFYTVINDLEHGASKNILYRLNKGKWNTVKNPNTINFSSLSPNDYYLELATYDKFTNKITIQKRLEIFIKNPFYRTIWFWSLITFGLSTILYFYFNRKKLNKQKAIFQQQLALEQQRNKITADLHDEIGSTLSSLQINSSVASFLFENNPKEAQKILEKIETQSEHLSDKIGDIIWSMKPGEEEFLTLTSRIKNFSNDILGSTNIQYSIKINPKIDYLIKDIATRKNIILFVKEAINNAAKYSKANVLNINIDIVNKTLTINISDDGIGFDTSKINGNGLGNMKKRMEELNGEFSIDSVINKGTSVKGIIPFVP